MGRGTEFFDYLSLPKGIEVAHRYAYINVSKKLKEFKKKYKLSAKRAAKQKKPVPVQAAVQAEALQLELF